MQPTEPHDACREPESIDILTQTVEPLGARTETVRIRFGVDDKAIGNAQPMLLAGLAVDRSTWAPWAPDLRRTVLSPLRLLAFCRTQIAHVLP